MSKKLKILLTILILLLETNCVRNTKGNDYCLIAFFIYASCPEIEETQKLGQDTQETCELIDIHNAIYQGICR